MHGPEKRARFQELRKTGLSRRAIARELGVSRRTLYVWEREGGVVVGPVPATPAGGEHLGPVQGADQGAAGAGSEAVGGAGVPGDPGVRVRRGIPAGEPVCVGGASPAEGGPGGPLRDEARGSRASGLRDLPVRLGSHACGGCAAGLLADAVVPVRGEPEAGGSDPGAGGRVRVLRGCPSGAAVRSDEGGGGSGRALAGRGAVEEPGLRAVRGALGLRDPGLPSVSCADEGEGGAGDPVICATASRMRGSSLRWRMPTSRRCAGWSRSGTGGS